MSSRFLAALRRKDGDKDQFSRHLRVLRATYSAILLGAAWLMFQSAWFGEFLSEPPPHPLRGPLCFSIAMFVVLASSKRDPELCVAAHRSIRLVLLLASALVIAEATALLGWWDLEEKLGWWRRALLVVAGAWVLFRPAEKAVEILRSRRAVS